MLKMRLRSGPLSTVETAALTRLVVSYCLGRGSLCLVSRSISLQISHSQSLSDYCHYQWRRICQYLPRTSPPKLYAIPSRKGDDPEAEASPGQWRLRVGSVHFAVAANLLYAGGIGRGLQLTSGALEIAGAEAIASLWADRGRLRHSRGGDPTQGRLSLSQFDFPSAAMIGQWLMATTGAIGELRPNPVLEGRGVNAPMIFFSNDSLKRLLGAVEDTWMAQATCLRHKFLLPRSRDLTTFMLRQSRSDGPPLDLEQLVEASRVPRVRTGGRKRRAVP
jgi:hypothetical protein